MSSKRWIRVDGIECPEPAEGSLVVQPMMQLGKALDGVREDDRHQYLTGTVVVRVEKDGAYEVIDPHSDQSHFNEPWSSRVSGKIGPSKTTMTLDSIAEMKKAITPFHNDFYEGIYGGSIEGNDGNPHLIDLSIGQPNWVLPPCCYADLHAATDPHNWSSGFDSSIEGDVGMCNRTLLQFNKYAQRRGVPELLGRLGDRLNLEKVGLSSHRHLMMGPGVKALLYYAMQALVAVSPDRDHEDYVLYSSPCWGVYDTQIRMAGGQPLDVPLIITTNQVRYDIKGLEEKLETAVDTNDRMRALILCSPNNPTSSCYLTSELLDNICTVVSKYRRLFIIIDGVYSDLILSGDTERVDYLEYFKDHPMRERVLLLGGFSKMHSLCGLRLGYAYSYNEEILDKMLIMSDAVSSCAPTMGQYIALSSLKNMEIMHSWYRQIKRELVERVNAFQQAFLSYVKWYIDRGDIIFPPIEGGFYAHLTLRVAYSTYTDCSEWCEMILKHIQVACIPGDAFRPSHAPNDLEFGEIRISLGSVSGVNEARHAGCRLGNFFDSVLYSLRRGAGELLPTREERAPLLIDAVLLPAHIRTMYPRSVPQKSSEGNDADSKATAEPATP